MKIEYVDVGIANNFGTHIELHKGLREFPHLHDAILKHELEHSKVDGFTKYDFMHDIKQAEFSYRDLMKFMIRNPKSLIQLLPIWKRGNTLFYDINMIIIWGFILLVMGLAIYIGFIL